MLSSSGRRWPDGGEWVLQPKWDGFRLLVEVGPGGVRAWSRHATNLTDRLGALLDAFADTATGTVFDGELVAIGQRDGRPTQDFAAVTRAVFAADAAAAARLHFVAFDILRHADEDLRPLPWRARDVRLRDVLPAGDRLRPISTQPATPEAHAAIVALGFEGSVLKRPRSTYRAGRHASWVKHKARCSIPGTLLAVYQDRDGTWQATCEVDGHRVRALAGARAPTQVDSAVEGIYSRVDADGGLREARIAALPVRRS